MKRFLLLLIALLITAGATEAAKKEIRMTADRLSYDQSGRTVRLSGTVRFICEDITLSGENAIFNTRTKKGRIGGGVRITQPGTVITGESMTVDYNATVAEMSGGVIITTTKDLVRKIRAQGSTTPTTLMCKSLRYNWMTQEGAAAGPVTVIQMDKRAYADNAAYNGMAGIVTLTGNVRFEEGCNNWVDCKKAVLDLRNETFTALGSVTGNFLMDVSEKDTDKKSAAGKQPDKLIIPELPYELWF